MEKEKLFARFQQYGTGATHDQGETVLALPGAIGEGFRREITLGAGLKLYLEHYTLRERLSASVKPEYFPLGISVCLSGSLNWTPVSSVPALTYQTRAGQMDVSVSALNTETGVIDCLPNDPVFLISLLIDPRQMGCQGAGLKFQEMISRSARDRSSAQDRSSVHFRRQSGPAMQAAARQMMDCRLLGPSRQVFLTSKSLELMALAMDRFEPAPRQAEDGAPRQGSWERERLYQAREILDREFTYPPGIERLARRTGLNQTKLKKGFKRLFNTTISAYLLDRRMETARDYLYQGDTTVSEVAFRVGYANRSHFTRAFTRCFGVPPITLLKKDQPV